MKSDNSQDAFVAFGDMAKEWGGQYQNADLSEKYPAGAIRLKIVLDILNNIKPKRILDVGCGTGAPLVAFLKNGYDAIGFDYADGMLDVARQNLMDAGFESGRVSKNNMENPEGYADEKFDCISALGSLYYARDFTGTMERVSKLLKPGGDFIFSLRNQLFSVFSMNSYTIDFALNQMIPLNDLTQDAKREITKDYQKAFGEIDVEKVLETIDDKGIHSLYHNPLSVQKEVLDVIDCELIDIYYYHFHALPPKYEHTMTEEFRRLSLKMENPGDWRGALMASTFIVHAKKSA